MGATSLVHTNMGATSLRMELMVMAKATGLEVCRTAAVAAPNVPPVEVEMGRAERSMAVAGDAPAKVVMVVSMVAAAAAANRNSQ